MLPFILYGRLAERPHHCKEHQVQYANAILFDREPSIVVTFLKGEPPLLFEDRE
jgi:hypothetical protein